MRQTTRLMTGSLLLIGLTACTSDNAPESPVANKTENGAQSYISINIYNSNGIATRADVGPTGENAQYEDGTGLENTISSVRFFFFSDNGDPVNVHYVEGESNLQNYVDIIPDDTSDKDNPNVEKLIAAQVVLSTASSDNLSLPTKMVTIINPDEAFKSQTEKTNYSLDGLKGLADDYAQTTASSKSYAPKGFTMSNSVYGDNGAYFENNIQSYISATSSAAIENPVDVYVERTVAKVMVNLAFDDTEKKTGNGYTYIPLYEDKDKKNPVKSGDNQVYIKIIGWNVASFVDKSRLVKNLTDCKNGDFTFALSWSDYHRSYWAVSDPTAQNKWTYGWNDLTQNFSTDYVYVNENTDETYEANMTKVVIGAQLVTLDNSNNETAYPYIKRGGMNYDTAKFSNYIFEWIKTNISDPIYVKTVNEDNSISYRDLLASDIDFTTADATAKAEGNELDKTELNGKRFFVYASLKSGNEYYDSSNKETAKKYSDDDIIAINKKLKNFGQISYYKDGMCYYSLAIKHLGDGSTGKGDYGVVRNHVYKCAIDAITGFGTPVYDPTEVIYPERPEDDNAYLAASINVLSWRIVANNYTLNW